MISNKPGTSQTLKDLKKLKKGSKEYQECFQLEKSKLNIQRFKGLGEMNPLQLRETTMAPDTRRLVLLTLERDDKAESMMDMLLAKKRAADRRTWLEEKGKLSNHD